MDKGIKKMLVIALIPVAAIIFLYVTLNVKLNKNTYASYINLRDLAVNRTTYVENFLYQIEKNDYDSVYNELTTFAKKNYDNNVNNMKNFIEEKILLSDEIENSYTTDIVSIAETEGAIALTAQVTIVPSDVDLAKELLNKSKVIRPIYVEVLEYGPNEYMINRIYEKDEW